MRWILLVLVACSAPAPRHVPSNRGGTIAPAAAADDLEIRPTGLRAGDYAITRSGRAITVTSTSQAEVFLDGKAYGVTPVRTDLPPGRHVLELRVAGY